MQGIGLLIWLLKAPKWHYEINRSFNSQIGVIDLHEHGNEHQ